MRPHWVVLEIFITDNRETIIANARARVEKRAAPNTTEVELKNGVPVFLDHLCAALRRNTSSVAVDNDALSASAGHHGYDLLQMGLTIGQVVHDYGDVCQAITALAIEKSEPVSTDDFKTLNLCLDDAIAQAVTAYSEQRDRTIADQGTERLGVLAHELRNQLNTAMLSFEIIKSGRVPAGGSTALIHGRALMGLKDLIDRSLADVRLDAGVELLEPISVAEFVEEVEIAAAIQAQARGHVFTVSSVDRTVTVQGDRQTLGAALSNMIQNAFKFTPKGGHISLTAHATGDRVLFDIADGCGGLPQGAVEELFRPFSQRGADRTGVGLGLAICVKAAKANGGEVRVRDVPGKGCVFTLDLPRQPPPPLSVVHGGQPAATDAPAPGKSKRGTRGS